MSIKIALAGNPNSGKTTLFNALTGSSQFVGNWPGVTVEKKEGKLSGYSDVAVVDLPGIYSLSPYTLEEVVTRNFLIDQRPDVILNIIDGTNIERNLYLSTQLTELGIPVLLAVNMMDVVEKSGNIIDIKKLSTIMGCEVIEISALKGTGIKQAAKRAVELALEKPTQINSASFSQDLEASLEEISSSLDAAMPKWEKRFYSIKLFERDNKIPFSLSSGIEEAISRLEIAHDDDSESIITNERYNFVTDVIKSCYTKVLNPKISITDKIDKIVTNRYFALPIFAAVMFIVYFISVTTVGSLLTDFVNDELFGAIILPATDSFLISINCAPWLQGLITNGIIGGVGAVLGFVPQMLVLFFFLAFLEGCGYMVRIAFIMDKIFRKFGLSGKSFIPMLIGTGCSVPGIMASRTIESENDRRMTIITTSFIPCGAKLPIIALIAGALFGGAWWVAPSAYFIGIAAVALSGIILKKTKMFEGSATPFVMELPSYRLPLASNLFRSTWERGWSFIKKAGTVVLLSTVTIWFCSSFGFEGGKLIMVEDLSNGLLADIGKSIAWIFAPLGFGTWEATVATITGLIAKENVVGTLGVLYGFGEAAIESPEMWGSLSMGLTPIAAYSFLVFNLLCAPCFAAIGAIKREMASAKWTWFALLYQTLFAYGVALCVNQFGLVLTGEGFGIGTAAAFIIIAFILYLLFRKDRCKSISLKSKEVNNA